MRRGLLAVPVALLALHAGGGPAEAARIPTWARGIVEESARAPHPDPYWNWRILFRESTVSVAEDGTVRTTRREVRQILDASIDEDAARVFFDSRTKIERLRAWHVPPERRRARRARGRDAIDVATGESFLSDDATRVLPVENLEKGSLVLIEAETTARRWALTWLIPVGASVPTLRERVVFEVPAGFTLISEWLRLDGPEPERSGGRHVWELVDLPGLRPEQLAPSHAERLPLLAVAVLAGNARIEPATFSTWKELGAWASRLVAEQQAEREALAAWQPDAPEPPAAVEELARRVRDRVRYVSVELGKNGWRPRPVAETLATSWGDCKDKAALLGALLDERGIRSWPVAVNLSERNAVPSRVPVIGAFDHMIVAVAAEGLGLDESRFGGALGDGGPLGPLLFFDPTDVYVPLGSLSSMLIGKRALVLAGDASRLVTLPGDDPRWHVREATLDGVMTGDGALAISWSGRYRGEPARIEWRTLRGSSRQQREDLERFWREIWPRAGSIEYEGDMDERTGMFVESASVTVRPPVLGEWQDLPLLPVPGWWLPHPRIGSRRRVGVAFGYPRTLRLRATWRGLDERWVLPAEVSRTIDGARARTSARRRDDGVVEVETEIVLERRTFAVDELRTLRRFLSTCRSVEGVSASRPAQPNTPGSSSPSDE
ncbi:MAG: DUF3857 domain-containing protein [Acidobacteria bacterium]|nr:MAG: DUF3857 domain-containing protein [Acidobacteriota bacterium]